MAIIKKDILTEFILYDVLDKIFTYLTLKELYRASIVCKSWQHIAKLEISKRNDIESVIWPITCDSDDDDFYEEEVSENNRRLKYLQNKWHYSDSIRSLPKLVLLFNDNNDTDCRNIEQYYVYHWSRLKIGTEIGAIDSLAVFLNNTEIVTNSNLGVAITIPSTPKLTCVAYAPSDHELLMHAKNSNRMTQFTDQIVNSLISPRDSHNCLIFFKNQGSEINGDDLLYSTSFFHEFALSLKKRCNPGSYSLWGGGVPLFITNVNNLGINNFVWFFIARISGPAFNSWSIVLKTDLSDTEKEEKLMEFKNNLLLQSKTVALAIAPSNKHESSEQRLRKTEIFRKIFPKISVVSIYEENEFVQIGVNRIICDSHPQMEHTNSVAYLIMTTE